jgi:mannan endo-1,4-beta-mannosidase
MSAHGFPSTWKPAATFARATGVAPRIVSYYSGWNEGFRSNFATDARAHGAVTLVQIDPNGVRLRAIAAGRYDSYLLRYARQVRAFAHPVIIGFAHEMNGSWYSWGYGHTPAAIWVGAWRHVVKLFRSVGAKNVVWLWTASHSDAKRLRSYWPGSKYVTWVGIDGYFGGRSASFKSVFGTALAAARRLARKPILLSETGVGPLTNRQAADIVSLFAGVKSYHLLGLVYFDVDQHDPPTRQDWRLEGHPALLNAFRRGARLLGIK